MLCALGPFDVVVFLMWPNVNGFRYLRVHFVVSCIQSERCYKERKSGTKNKLELHAKIWKEMFLINFYKIQLSKQQIMITAASKGSSRRSAFHKYGGTFE